MTVLFQPRLLQLLSLVIQVLLITVEHIWVSSTKPITCIDELVVLETLVVNDCHEQFLLMLLIRCWEHACYMTIFAES